jgi:serine/threonine-protein kinase
MSPAELGHDLGPLRLTGIIRQDAQLALCAAVHRQRAERRLVKLLLPGAFPGAAVRRFLRQAGSLAALQHPGLSPVFESARLSSGAAYVVLPPPEGEPADEWLRRAGGLAARPMIAAAIVAAVAESCSRLGRLEIVHGDLRAGSLRLTQGPRPGLFTVKVVGSEEAALRSWRVVDGQTGPAPACRAPELWRSGAVPDVRSDIYALGCLYLELLTGAPAFQAENEGAWRTAHCEHPPPFVPGIAVETRRLMGRMLAKAPEQRYQSMDEIVTAVELMLGRHRSRLAELLVAEPPLRAPEPEAGSSDLTPLDPRSPVKAPTSGSREPWAPCGASAPPPAKPSWDAWSPSAAPRSTRPPRPAPSWWPRTTTTPESRWSSSWRSTATG